MSKREKLEALYKRIPPVDCIPGCTDCCGAGIPVSTMEVAAMGPIPMVAMGNGFSLQMTPRCAHAAGNNCAIHDRRPFICRLFGSIARAMPNTPEKRMLCPHGRTPKKPLSQKEAAKLTAEYFRLAAIPEGDDAQAEP